MTLPLLSLPSFSPGSEELGSYTYSSLNPTCCLYGIPTRYTRSKTHILFRYGLNQSRSDHRDTMFMLSEKVLPGSTTDRIRSTRVQTFSGSSWSAFCSERLCLGVLLPSASPQNT